MKKKAIFTSKSLIQEIKDKTNTKQKNIFFRDIVTENYYRCYGITFDKNGNLLIDIKSLDDLFNGINDLY